MKINAIQNYTPKQNRISPSFGHAVLGRDISDIYSDNEEASEFIKSFKELQKTKINLRKLFDETFHHNDPIKIKVVEDFFETIGPEEVEDYTVKIYPDTSKIYYKNMETTPQIVYYGTSIPYGYIEGTKILYYSPKSGKEVKDDFPFYHDELGYKNQKDLKDKTKYTVIKSKMHTPVYIPTSEQLIKATLYGVGAGINNVTDNIKSQKNS